MMQPIPFPGITPECVREKLMPYAKTLGYEFGRESKMRGLVVTDDLMELVVLMIVGGLSCGAHEALKNRDILLAESTVREWIA